MKVIKINFTKQESNFCLCEDCSKKLQELYPDKDKVVFKRHATKDVTRKTKNRAVYK